MIKKEITFETLNHLINQLDMFDESPLHIASQNNYHNSVEWLLKNGANVNVRNDEGLLPDELELCDDKTKKLMTTS